MSNRAKRHHIVPQTLQRPFCDHEGKLWFAEKNAAGTFKEPELRSPNGAFWVRDYYTVLEDDAPSDVIETGFYGNLDNFLGQLIPQFNLRLEASEAPVMDVELQNALKVAIFELIKRTPDFIKVSDYDVGLEFLEGVLAEEGKGTVTNDRRAELRAELDKPHKIKARGRDIRVRGSLSRSGNVEEALKSRSFRYVVAKKGHSFILSNAIAYRIGNGGSNRLQNPESEIWMPISPRFAIALVADPTKKIPLICESDRDHVREINEYAASQSRSIASHSKKLIDSITRFRKPLRS